MDRSQDENAGLTTSQGTQAAAPQRPSTSSTSTPVALHSTTPHAPPAAGASTVLFRNKNRRGIGNRQSKWTASKRWARPLTFGRSAPPQPVRRAPAAGWRRDGGLQRGEVGAHRQQRQRPQPGRASPPPPAHNGCLIEAPWPVNGGHGASSKQAAQPFGSQARAAVLPPRARELQAQVVRQAGMPPPPPPPPSQCNGLSSARHGRRQTRGVRGAE
jgi:hypothetical protein